VGKRPSQPPPERRLEPRAIVAREAHRRAVVEQQLEVPIGLSSKQTDPLKVHDGRAVYAHEPGAIQHPLQLGQRVLREILPALGVAARVAALRLDV